MSETARDAEAVGVGMALERMYALEARLRAAVQTTHSLADSLDRNPVAADREREALLNITYAPRIETDLALPDRYSPLSFKRNRNATMPHLPPLSHPPHPSTHAYSRDLQYVVEGPHIR